MKSRNAAFAALGAAVAVTAGVLVTGVAGADGQPAAAPSSASASVPSGTAAEEGQASVYNRYGQVFFMGLGEHMFAKDGREDGRSVTAQLYWDGAIRASVKDPTGSKSGVGHKNLSISNGKTVYLRMCVSGVGCTAWARSVA